MNKFIAFFALAVLAPVSCIEEQIDPAVDLVEVVFDVDNMESRTYVDGSETDNGKLAIKWCEDDAISVWDGVENRKFTMVGEPNGASATFKGIVSASATDFYAIYPYDEDLTCSETNGSLIFSVSKPAVQYANPEGGLADNSAYACGKVDQNGKISMVHRSVLLKFSFAGGMAVKSFTLIGNAEDDILAGRLNFKYDAERNFTVGYKNDGTRSRQITLCNRDGSILKTGVDYYMSLTGTLFDKGYTVMLTMADGTELIKSSDKSVQYYSGSVYKLAGKPLSSDMFDVMEEPDVEVGQGEEFTYKTVEYRRKSNGAYPYDYETTNSTKTLTVDGMNWMKKSTVNEHDRWGGNPDLKVAEVRSSNPEGFWRTGKVGNRWYFINPDGHATVLHGVNGVNPDPARDGTTVETQQWYNNVFGGDVMSWATFAGNILKNYSFNFFNVSPRRAKYYWDYMTDASTELLRSPDATIENGQVETLYLLRTFAWDYNSIYGKSISDSEYNKFILLFNPKYLEYIEKLAKEATAPFKDSKNIVGYYIDNELTFNSYRDLYPLKGIELEHFLTLVDRFTDEFKGPREYAENFMRDRGVEPVKENITKDLRDEFRYEVARYYYKTTTEAIRKADPNHLILGSRLFDSSMYNEWTVKACAEYCDAVSVNYYNYWQPTEEYCKNQLGTWIDKPFIVTEFYVKDENASYGSVPYENLEGAGWIVRNQKARGYYYQNFCIRLLEMCNCAGWMWFEFMDNYGSAVSGSTKWTGSNKGIVSARFEPYQECLDLMHELHLNIYNIIDYFDHADYKPVSTLEPYTQKLESYW